MLTSLIKLSIENRFLVLVLTGLMAVGGLYSALHLPIDAVPDMTNTQVTVITTAGALSPLEVERYVTYPVEWTMGGLPKLTQLRSTSQFGLSVVTIVFEDGTDIYWARNLVSQKLQAAKNDIPDGYGDPELGPLATALGEVLQFEVKGAGYTPMQLRSILDWEIAPQLRGVKGVTEVNVHGGFYKSFEVRPEPDRLAAFDLSLADIFETLEQNNLTSGGGYVEHYDERRFIRGQALLQTADAIEQVVIRNQPNGSPLLIKDVADVVVGPLVRQGAVTRDGRGEIVTGMVMMLFGENSREVVQAAKARLTEISRSLPEGVTIELIYDRASLIDRTLHTVLTNLTEGGVLVIVILLVMLGSLRAGIIVALAIPLSMLFAANLMSATGITASLMSLGAIDFGLIVDSSVIMIENCIRRLSHSHLNAAHDEVILDAAVEVRKPTMFGELIISVVYLPVLLLQGTEGKLFRPMAWTVLFALGGSLILSLTLMPVLATIALPKKMSEKEGWLIRFVKWFYVPILEHVIRHRITTIAVAFGVFAVSIPVALRLGAEFMPRLEEGDILVEMVRLPTATLEGSEAATTRVEKLLLTLPEVKTVFCKTGRPEIASDVMGVNQTDVWVMLKPEVEWPTHKLRDALVDEMRTLLNENVGGAVFGFSQPIEMRVNELVAGVKADVAVLLYGDDLETLARKSKEIERVLRTIPGAADVKANYQANLSTLGVYVQPERLARYGINARQVMDAVAAMGGRECGQVFEGRARYPIMVRLPSEWREKVDLLEQVPVSKSGGKPIPLGELADLKFEEIPPNVDHEAARRRTFIMANVRERDVATFVQEAKAAIEREVRLPAGYLIRWGGNFEHLQTASLRLVLITPLVLLVIFLLLYTSVRSVSLAALIFLAVPMAASGGIYALALREMHFSISAGVGFIALFGVAVLNGLVWVSGAEHLRAEGVPLEEAAEKTAVMRLRPVLMTAMVASFGFIPMALSTTPGAEIQRPLATVVIGGLLTSTLLTTLVLPTIYPWFCPREYPSST
ncbi:MAG TPA: CusA/CzcA family heavy metal efflux RND transporter [Planctomycetaceae bacterium]|nr:CusA/CzcA family heavy metal efflux RND transporter [Planctomycetaceae bacterium]